MFLDSDTSRFYENEGEAYNFTNGGRKGEEMKRSRGGGRVEELER